MDLFTAINIHDDVLANLAKISCTWIKVGLQNSRAFLWILWGTVLTIFEFAYTIMDITKRTLDILFFDEYFCSISAVLTTSTKTDAQWWNHSTYITLLLNMAYTRGFYPLHIMIYMCGYVWSLREHTYIIYIRRYSYSI